MLSLMPIRHKHIRDALVKIKNKPSAKLHLLESLENSENFTKLVLGDDYKHFSVDYPEVQIILQMTEDEKKKSTLKKQIMLYKDTLEFKIGESYEGKHHDLIFHPFSMKGGKTIRLSKNKKEIKEKENWEYKKLGKVERKIYRQRQSIDRKNAKKKDSDIGEIKVYKV